MINVVERRSILEKSELEALVRQVLSQILIKDSSLIDTTFCEENKQKEEIVVVETIEHSFCTLSYDTQRIMEEKFHVVKISIEDAIKKKPLRTLLLDCPFNIQAEAATGVATSPESYFLHQAFIDGREVYVLTDNLCALNEISSFEYRKLFAEYQRKLKEFGLIFISQETLQEKKAQKKIVIEKDIDLLARGSTLTIRANDLLSYGAKKKIKEKNILIKKR